MKYWFLFKIIKKLPFDMICGPFEFSTYSLEHTRNNLWREPFLDWLVFNSRKNESWKLNYINYYQNHWCMAVTQMKIGRITTLHDYIKYNVQQKCRIRINILIFWYIRGLIHVYTAQEVFSQLVLNLYL